jgi:predicted PurR-regulated permease PerM
MLQSLNKLPRLLTVGMTFPIIFLNGWLLLQLARSLEPLVSILIAATLIAFLLDYPIRFLQQLGVRRGWAVGIVFLVFIFVLGTLGFVLGPLVLRQINELIIRLPEWIKSGQQQLRVLEAWATEQQLPINLSGNITQVIEKLSSALRSVTSQLLVFVFSTIGSLVNIFLTIVFSIFLVLRGKSLWDGILGWLPLQWNDQIRNSLPQNFEGYIVGQVTMAVIISIMQTLMLVIVNAPLALLFGLAIGVSSLIPFGGTTAILVVTLLLALQNFWLGVKVLVAAEIILQIGENFIGPRVLGEITGLNPVWTLISLFIGVKLGGVLGLVLAVPIASFIKGATETLRSSWSSTMAVVPAERPSLPEEAKEPAASS